MPTLEKRLAAKVRRLILGTQLDRYEAIFRAGLHPCDFDPWLIGTHRLRKCRCGAYRRKSEDQCDACERKERLGLFAVAIPVFEQAVGC